VLLLFFASRIAIILFLYLYMYFYRLAVNKSCSMRGRGCFPPASRCCCPAVWVAALHQTATNAESAISPRVRQLGGFEAVKSTADDRRVGRLVTSSRPSSPHSFQLFQTTRAAAPKAAAGGVNFCHYHWTTVRTQTSRRRLRRTRWACLWNERACFCLRV